MIMAIVQARMGSMRSPGKVMSEINHYPMLNHVITHLKKCKRIDDIIVATSTNIEDDIIYNTCKKWNVKCFRGHPTNVLERYYDCVRDYIFENKLYLKNELPSIVRITADCPLHCSEIIDDMIDCFNKEKIDYMSNVIKRTFPHGMDVEIFSYKALIETYKNATSDYDMEHVCPYMKTHLTCYSYENDIDYSNIRVTVDYPEDLELVGEYFKSFYKTKKYHNYTLQDLVNEHEVNTNIRLLERNIKEKYKIGNGNGIGNGR